MSQSFSFAPTPSLIFGSGKLSQIAGILKPFGSRVALITGAHSFDASPHCAALKDFLKPFLIERVRISSEPTPAMIDEAVDALSSFDPAMVVAIGGGSVMDAGKAVAAMLPLRESIRFYLEGIGTKTHPGTKVPFIAIPTTSGTGSEATKNAVISEVGEHGFKKSLRHNNFIPNVAIIDPSLTTSCSPEVTGASGMDAFTQLLESYLSTAANPITDALALEGLKHIASSLLPAYQDGGNLAAREGMALAAYLSGIILANAGLGLVHGFASSVGGFFNLPHGVICSTLMAPSNNITVKKLRASADKRFLHKYATVGKLFVRAENHTNDYYVDGLLDTIAHYTSELNIPVLSSGGVTSDDFHRIVSKTDAKYNPVTLHPEEMMEVLAWELKR